ENVFGALYNLRAVPYGICVDEQGRIVRPPQGISVSKSEVLQELERWIKGEPVTFDASARTRDQSDPKVKEADLRFALGSLLLSQGRTDEAVAEWRRALALDPENWIIHKQIWAVENPDRFYEGSVDYGWQKQELRREKDSADAG
ncbi:MAG: tetratricopeptide repeat protein, partial [Armatimonadota bacterium]